MFGIESNADIHGEEWAPISDLMAALMLVFMFIAIVFIRTIVAQDQVFKSECDKIFRLLDDEFHDDFNLWDAELDDDLTIRFKKSGCSFCSGRR